MMFNHKPIVSAVWFICGATFGWVIPPATASAQDTHIAPIVSKHCSCGRWTCPACQQQNMQQVCPPGQFYMPGTTGMAPGITTLPPLGDSANQSPDAAQADPSASDANANADAANQPNLNIGQDLQNTLAQSSSQRNFMGINSGGLADPGMIGDYYGPGSNGASIITQSYVNGYNQAYSPVSIFLPASSFAGQRMKIAENTSPIPQNRIFVNYSMFDNVPLTSDGMTVNRVSPGFETLLFSANTSFEMRTPMASTLDSNVLLDGGTDTSKSEFGNMFFSLKHAFINNNQLLLSSGLSMTVPTADDIRVINGTGTDVVRIQNESVHLMPFLGGYYKPSQRSFVQSFMQIDVDVNGNSVYFNENIAQNNLTEIGRLQDMTLMYLDFSAGYWIYRAQGRGLTGIAPLIESHYNRSLNNADCVVDSSGQTSINVPIQEYDNLNIVSAMVFEFNRRSRLAVGYGLPIGNGSDRSFDNELRITFNRFF